MRKKLARMGKICHDWINFPNYGSQKCLRCGCMKYRNNKDVTYYRDGITYDTFIDCIPNKEKKTEDYD